MEQFFTPTRPVRPDLYAESTHGDDRYEHTEVQLAVPVEDFLAYNWDWKDLRAFLNGGNTPKILWITEYTFLVVIESGNTFVFDFDLLSGFMDAIFQETSDEKQEELYLAHLDHPADLSTVEAGVFWRAVATSNSVKLRIEDFDDNRLPLPSGPLLSQFLRESLSLQCVNFHSFDFKEEHCLAFATLQRHDIEITLNTCTFEPQDSEDTFIEWFRHNQVVTELVFCDMDRKFLSALSGNNSVQKLVIEKEFRAREMRSLVQALPGNMGIEDLNLTIIGMSDKTWSLLFRSLSTHPRIKRLSLSKKRTTDHSSLSAESKSTWMKAILQMLYLNTVVCRIHLPDSFNDEAVYQNAILPRLEMNRTCFEVQRQAVKRADPAIRPQLLGRALHAVRYNSDLVFLFLSENVPAFIRTDEEEEDSAIPLQNDPAIDSGQKRKAP
jgi:hypothetical protein